MWKLGKITAKTHIGDYGQIVDSFVLLLKDTCCEEVKMTNGTDFILEKNCNDLTGKVNAKGVTEISICETEEGTEVELILDPFVYRYDFKVTGTIAGTEVSFTRADVDKVWIKDMDQFVAYEENGVHYRMYEPECMGKRPLVLFLHGGGECGEDNELQLTGTRCTASGGEMVGYVHYGTTGTIRKPGNAGNVRSDEKKRKPIQCRYGNHTVFFER